MDWNQVLVAAMGGAVGGGVGALIGAVVGRLLPMKWRSAAISVLGVALGLICSRAAVTFYTPAAAPASIEAELLADPRIGTLAHAWREGDPEAFQAFVARLQSARGANTANPDQSRAELMASLGPRMLLLNDEQTVEQVRVARDQMRELATSHPIVCHPLFHGNDFGDITPYLSTGVEQREIALMVAAFHENPSVTREALSGEALAAAIDALVAETRAVVGDDIALIAPDSVVEGREARVCEVIATLYDRLLSRSPPETARTMRGIMGRVA